MARQRLGQHFLADPGWREEIARAIRVSPQSIAPASPGEAKGSCWLEIGAGHGEMTEHLASIGAPVYAIELDAQLASRLQRLTKRFPNLTVIPGDVLEIDIAQLAAGRKLRIYGNLPYYITSPILHHLFASAELIEEIHISSSTKWRCAWLRSRERAITAIFPYLHNISRGRNWCWKSRR